MRGGAARRSRSMRRRCRSGLPPDQLRVAADQIWHDDRCPGTGEQPAVDQRTAFVLRQPAGALALQVPHRHVVQPDRCAGLQTLQAEVGVLVMSEHVVVGEAAQLLEPGAVDRHECAGHRGHRPRLDILRRPGWRALAVMLHPQDRPLRDAALCRYDAGVGLEIHAAMHQRAVVVEQRRAEQRGLLRRQRRHQFGVPLRPVRIAREDVGIDAQDAVAAGELHANIVGHAETRVVRQRHQADREAVDHFRDARLAVQLFGQLRTVDDVDELVIGDSAVRVHRRNSARTGSRRCRAAAR